MILLSRGYNISLTGAFLVCFPVMISEIGQTNKYYPATDLLKLRSTT